MDYDNLLTKWFESEVSDAEADFIFSAFMKKLRAGEELSSREIRYLFECSSLVDTQLSDSYKHGWNIEDYIVEPMPNEFYSFCALTHDDYGMEYESQVCPRVELKQIMVDRWVPVDENRT